MKFIPKDPALEIAIESFGAAVCRDDADAALSIADASAESDLTAMLRNCAMLAGAKTFSQLALAKIGVQFVLKARVIAKNAERTYLVRWRADSAKKWRIAWLEDLSDKRSPWSDIPALAAARAEAERG